MKLLKYFLKFLVLSRITGDVMHRVTLHSRIVPVETRISKDYDTNQIWLFLLKEDRSRKWSVLGKIKSYVSVFLKTVSQHIISIIRIKYYLKRL